MKIIKEKIGLGHLKKIAEGGFGNLVKAVVDVDKEILAIDAELHSDLEALLLGDGSQQRNLWGINLYPDVPGDDFIEFDSMINMRPSQNNKSRSVESEEMRRKIAGVVQKWIHR